MGRKVLYEKRGPLAYVTLNRPEVHNCIDRQTLMVLSMFLRRDAHSQGAGAFVGKTRPEWKHHGL
jgi:enoyl-CoA hydratase/carnithine racemase